uniref:Uncharacterized protein n=1 Tax=Cannabis sativa TaxID=3483 RepID=A0A803Q7Y0_CANSA
MGSLTQLLLSNNNLSGVIPKFNSKGYSDWNDKIFNWGSHDRFGTELEVFGNLNNANVLTPLAYVLYADKAYLFYEYSSKGTLFSSGMGIILKSLKEPQVGENRNGALQGVYIYTMRVRMAVNVFALQLWSNSAGTANSNSKTAVNMLDFSNKFSRTSFSTTNQMLADLKVFY